MRFREYEYLLYAHIIIYINCYICNEPVSRNILLSCRKSVCFCFVCELNYFFIVNIENLGIKYKTYFLFIFMRR